MIKRLLLLSLSVVLVAALLCVTHVLAQINCDPDCSGSAASDKVPDPLNCTQYYICLAPNLASDAPVSCPEGQDFVDTACADPAPDDPPCKPTCTLNPCHLTCAADLEKISDPKSCNNYYYCVGTSAVGPVECPVGTPYFDGTICGTDDTKCCGDLCIPYCYPKVVEAPDPYDCTRYYMCPEEGLASELNHNTCPSGSNFDLAMGYCVVGAPCNTLCSDTTVPGVSTTPSSGCQESMTCTSVGLFPKCTTCDQQYFNCRTVGQPAIVETCTGSLLFNTDPSYPYCVKPDDCPHHVI
ncbi:peritrophin-48-like [Procambarus clarkii]|uniref:peritrophin-48-like n=1 Tax=Procambarus clarkii TaxID=6728 RepID=UPI00374356C0